MAVLLFLHTHPHPLQVRVVQRPQLDLAPAQFNGLVQHLARPGLVAQHAGVAGEVVPDEALIAEPVQAFMQLVTRLLRALQLVQGEGTIYPAGEPAGVELDHCLGDVQGGQAGHLVNA